jgi:hypothetical protein
MVDQQESAADELGLEEGKLDIDSMRVPLAVVFRCTIDNDTLTFVLPLLHNNLNDTR